MSAPAERTLECPVCKQDFVTSVDNRIFEQDNNNVWLEQYAILCTVCRVNKPQTIDFDAETFMSKQDKIDSATESEYKRLINRLKYLEPTLKAIDDRKNNAYFKRVEVKARLKEYSQRIQVKAKQMEYKNRPEIKARIKESMKDYHSQPEVQERVKKYKAKPEVMEKARVYGRAYMRKRKLKLNAEMSKKKITLNVEEPKVLVTALDPVCLE